MKVIWTSEALQDRLDIWEYIATDNPLAAVHMDELFSAAASTLADFPNKGRLGTVAGTRELIPTKTTALFIRWRLTRSGFSPWCMSPECGLPSKANLQPQPAFDTSSTPCMPQKAKAPETLGISGA